MKSKKTNPHLGSNFDDFLRSDGSFEEIEAAALKKVIALALDGEMKRRRVSVSRLAEVLGTSRAAINRVLDVENTSITLNTLSRMATALGCRLQLEIVTANSAARGRGK